MSPSSSSEVYDAEDVGPVDFSPKHVALPTLAVIIVVSNSCLIVIIASNKRLRNVPGMLLVSIALADIIGGFPAIPLHVAAELSRNQPAWFCLLAMSMSAFQILVTVLTLFVHIVERYLFLAHPLHHKKWTRRRTAVIIIILVWFYSFVFGSLPLLGWNALDYTWEQDDKVRFNGGNSSVNVTGATVRRAVGADHQTVIYYTASPELIAAVTALPSCRFDVVHRGSYLGLLFFMHVVPVCIIVPVFYAHILFQARQVLKRRTPSITNAAALSVTTFSFVSKNTAHLTSPYARQISMKSNTATSTTDYDGIETPPVSLNTTSLQRLRAGSMAATTSPPPHSTVPTSPSAPATPVVSSHHRPSLTPALPRLSLGGRCDLRRPPPGFRVHHRPHLRPFFLLFIALLLFVLNWIPTMIWHSILFRGFTKDIVTDIDFLNHPLPEAFWFAGVIFGAANSAINPFLFGLGNTQVRRAFKRTICASCRKETDTRYGIHR